jgi:hypothetical protein
MREMDRTCVELHRHGTITPAGLVHWQKWRVGKMFGILMGINNKESMKVECYLSWDMLLDIE